MKNNRAYQLSEITYNAVLEDAKASSYKKLFAILKKAIPLNEHLEFHLAQLNKLRFEDKPLEGFKRGLRYKDFKPKKENNFVSENNTKIEDDRIFWEKIPFDAQLRITKENLQKLRF